MIESSPENVPALIVEDSEPLRQIFKLALERADFEVECAEDGRLALERLAVTTPALVLLDLHLPDVSGEEILDYIKAEERLAKTVVILSTADLFKASSLRHQVDVVLTKPFSFMQLHDLAKGFRSQMSGPLKSKCI
jgi:two-component system alkaline phosphatase synthesis response regulator PhoP